MTVRRGGQIIRLEGDCRVEDAEALVTLLESDGDLSVDLTACRLLHGAVLQALLWYRPVIAGDPTDPFLRTWIFPILSAAVTEARGSRP